MLGLQGNSWRLKFSNKITHIIICVGAYTPVTKEGNILVDGVLASCYSFVDDHELAHIGMMPVRWFPEIVQWAFGDDDGYLIFAETAKQLHESLLLSKY